MNQMAQRQTGGRGRVRGWLVISCALLVAACAESIPPFGSSPFYFVAGEITPEHFDFHDVIPHTGPEDEPGGWQEACIHARMRNFKTGQSAVCNFQTGVPIVAKMKGRILKRDVQVVAARAANRAARTILGGGTPPGIACSPFRKIMTKLMKDDGIPGANIKPCDGKVPPIYFDPER
jgi:hypothetical protein